MKSRILIGIVLIALFIFTSCWGPKKSPEEENVLNALSIIQGSFETEASYEQFIQLLARVKSEIDILKGKKKNNPCFMSSVDKCIASYTTCAKAWEQKMQATDEIRKQDMDLTLSVMQSFAALNIQRASNCYKK
jgi:hypothetical protein